MKSSRLAYAEEIKGSLKVFLINLNFKIGGVIRRRQHETRARSILMTIGPNSTIRVAKLGGKNLLLQFCETISLTNEQCLHFN